MTLEPQGPVSAGPGRAEGTVSAEKGTTAKANPNPDIDKAQKPLEDAAGRADQTDKGTSKGKQAPAPSDTEDAFDLSQVPEEIRPQVEAAVKLTEKQLKANYTKKTQEIAKQRHKVEAYDAFESNPVETMKQMADRYGFQLNPKGAPAKPSNGGAEPDSEFFTENWQPPSWKHVGDGIDQRINTALSQFMEKIQPVFQNLQQLTTKSIEGQLSEIDPDWKLYEDDMTSNLKAHPTLAKDVSKLYRMSVPDDVLETRATQKALKRFEEKARSAKVGSKSTVQSSTASGNKVNSFQDAVSEAKRKIQAGEV